MAGDTGRLLLTAWWFATQGSPCPQSSCRLSAPFRLWSCTGFCLPLWFPRISTWKTAPMAIAIAATPPRQNAVERQLQMSTWLVCFNRYLAVKGSVYPRMLPQMLAYSNIIIQAQLQFSGDDWLTYDRMFCIAAATSWNTNWRNVDASLYGRFVSCQPRRGGVCQLCCSTAHRSTACLWGVDEPAPPEQLSAVQTPWYPRLMQPWSSGPPSSLQWPPNCTSWNVGNCRF